MNHTQLLNHLAAKYNLKSYLEIGVQRTAQNFDKIKCKNKVGVDPAIENKADMVGYPDGVVGYEIVVKTASDEYFMFGMETGYDEFKVMDKFDLIFIDGLHHSDQVERDFNNSLKCLNDGGFVIVHDVLPEDESTTHVPRDSKVWHGDVYKWGMLVKYNYDNINFVTINIDCGCMVIWKDSSKKRSNNFGVHFAGFDSMVVPNMWDYYSKHKRDNMNIIEPSELDKYLPKGKETV